MYPATRFARSALSTPRTHTHPRPARRLVVVGTKRRGRRLAVCEESELIKQV